MIRSCLQFLGVGSPANNQVPLYMEFSRQGHCSGLPCHPPGDLPNPGIEPAYPALAGGLFTTGSTGEARILVIELQLKLDSLQSILVLSTWSDYSSICRHLCLSVSEERIISILHQSGFCTTVVYVPTNVPPFL
ncbi:unnamed protein product [Rangifer tarandus platyrhynchus]|uniref:Uncharacterized protein n=1 Tax=Rangifer tarandus platyrhynchus TaxID=3082113 RepID=A0ABN8ZVU4_RANTA|nr:unnamed protein product [Rangifer tarandus platyrhynchus]